MLWRNLNKFLESRSWLGWWWWWWWWQWWWRWRWWWQLAKMLLLIEGKKLKRCTSYKQVEPPKKFVDKEEKFLVSFHLFTFHQYNFNDHAPRFAFRTVWLTRTSWWRSNALTSALQPLWKHLPGCSKLCSAPLVVFKTSFPTIHRFLRLLSL